MSDHFSRSAASLMHFICSAFLGTWLAAMPLASQAQQAVPPASAPLSEDSVRVMARLVQTSVRQLRGIYFEPSDARATQLIEAALRDLPARNQRLSHYTSSLSREQQQDLAQRLRQQPWQQELRSLQQSPQFRDFEGRVTRTPALKAAAARLRAAGFLGNPPPPPAAAPVGPTAAGPAKLPAVAAPPAHAPLRPAMVRHTVRKGETLFSIARRYNVTPAQLRAWNKKADVVVRIGEILFLNPAQ
jgi:hypothetical protein